jgi:Skp family chaperone for outer membrane proteins
MTIALIIIQIDPSSATLTLATMTGAVTFLFSVILKILYDSVKERKDVQKQLNILIKDHSMKIERMVAENKAEVKKLTDESTEESQSVIAILHDNIKFHEKINNINHGT